MHKVAIFYTRLLIAISIFAFPLVYALIYLAAKKKANLGMVKILIIPQLTRIGDIVCSTPVFRAIKTKYPNSHISLLVSSNASAIIKNNHRIDEVIIFEDYEENFFELIKKIRESKFDFGISLSGTALSSLLFFFGLIPNRMKITRNERPLAEIFTDWMCNIKEKYEHLSYLPAFYLNMLRHIGVINDNTQKEVFTSKISEEIIDSFFKKKLIVQTDKLVGVSITAGNKIKEWGDEKFAVLAKTIVDQYSAKIIFIGSERDRERINKLINKIGGGDHYISAAGVSLENLPALMSKLTVFISVDTGPIHIAEALDIPLIDILGPVNDIELTPRGKNVQIVKPAEGISPTVFAFHTPGDEALARKALDSIKIKDVISAFQRIETSLSRY